VRPHQDRIPGSKVAVVRYTDVAVPDEWSANLTLGLLQGCPSLVRDQRQRQCGFGITPFSPALLSLLIMINYG
jgi:hypothetical protein